MNVYTFSLPEGCDLRLQAYWTSASVQVVFEDTALCVLDTFILGEGLSVRRGVLGTTFVSSTPDPVAHYDFKKHIVNALKRYRDNHEAQTLLDANLKHFEGSAINPHTMNMIRQEAQRSFDQTRERMQRAASVAVATETLWSNTVFERQIERAPDFRASDLDVVRTLTQGVIRDRDEEHILDGYNIRRVETVEQVTVTSAGDIVTIHTSA